MRESLEQRLRRQHAFAVEQQDMAARQVADLAKRIELLASGSHLECPDCAGRGDNGNDQMPQWCGACHGKGHVPKELVVAKRLMNK